MATENDKVILKLKKEIEAKKASLKGVKKFEPVTNCNLTLDGNRYNIHVADKETLLLLISKIATMEIGLNAVLPNEDLTIGGFTSKEWLRDLTEKFANLNISTEEKRLKTLEDKLHNLLSTDTKVGLEIEDLKSQI
jgi:hypothetical protein